MKKAGFLLVVLVFLWSCQTKSPGTDTSTSKEPVFNLVELWRTDSIMKTPESVLYDPIREVLYVANMNRIDEGETGFISKLNTDGSIIDLNWITGLKEPRGMGLHGNLLFATDSDRILVIDVEKGELVKAVPIDGAVFLNDLAVSSDGKVYFSDSRVGRVQVYANDNVSTWLDSVPGANGLFDAGDYMLVSASGSKELRKVNKATGEYDVIATGLGIDGIESADIDDFYIVSEWKGTIHMVGQDTLIRVLDTEAAKINSADIGYSPKDKIIYVPTFHDNRVVAYSLKEE